MVTAKLTLATKMLHRLYEAEPEPENLLDPFSAAGLREPWSLSEAWGTVATGAEPCIPADELLRTILRPVADDDWLRDNWYDPVRDVDELASTFNFQYTTWGDTVRQILRFHIAHWVKL
jgi:hypothetical protein